MFPNVSHCQTANSFGISRGSVSLTIQKVSKAIVEFLGKDYMKLPETVAEVENLTQKFLEHHGFRQYIGAIDVHTYQYANLIKTMLTTLIERGLHPSIFKPFAITVITLWM